MIDMMAAIIRKGGSSHIIGFDKKHHATNTPNPNQKPTFHTVDSSEIPNNHRLDVSNLL